MSVDTPGAPEAIEIPLGGDAGFASLMDALVSSEDTATTVAGDPPAGPAAGGAGQPAAPAEGTGTAGAPAAAPDAGAPAVAGVPDAGVTPAGSSADPAWTVDADSIAPKWGEISNAIETQTQEISQRAALDEVRGEYTPYFEAIEKHPRLLVGTKVPKIGGADGEMETLRDSDDAKEWQDAVKNLLGAEIRDRAVRVAEESSDSMRIVHASIELFQNNHDLIPGTKQFDLDLANRFAALAQPYELRVDGKLYGYSIPPQPLITQLRAQLSSERAAAPAPAAASASAPATGAPVATAPAPAPVAVDPPQAGITSKAGAGGEAEDFSVLFGTIGLPNLRI